MNTLIFTIADNFYTGIFALISYVLTIILIGDFTRRILKISILSPILDSIFYALLFTVIISTILDFSHVYSIISVVSVSLIIFIMYVFVLIRDYKHFFLIVVFASFTKFIGSLYEFPRNFNKNFYSYILNIIEIELF